jgi:hypothetical protein
MILKMTKIMQLINEILSMHIHLVIIKSIILDWISVKTNKLPLSISGGVSVF